MTLKFKVDENLPAEVGGISVHSPGRRIVRQIVFLIVLIIAALVMFGPSDSFHHQYGFGRPIMYMVWNGEDPDPNAFKIDGMEVIFSPVAFGAQVALWLGLVGFGIWILRQFHQG